MYRWCYFLLFFTLVALADTTRVGDKTALVIIDMQEPFVTRGGNAELPDNIRKVREITERQLELIRVAREQNIPIIFLEYENFGPTNSQLREAVNGYGNTRTFQKTTDGMLDSWNSHLGELSDYLQNQEIGNLIITGANGGACVSMSIYGSLRNNYNVIAYSRGIADFNFENFIYPYDDQYADYEKPDCPSCTFREVDDLPTLTTYLSNSSRTSRESAVNNSERSEPKPDVRRPSSSVPNVAPTTTQQ